VSLCRGEKDVPLLLPPTKEELPLWQRVLVEEAVRISLRTRLLLLLLLLLLELRSLGFI
jgi:hypothetical protein